MLWILIALIVAAVLVHDNAEKHYEHERDRKTWDRRFGALVGAAVAVGLIMIYLDGEENSVRQKNREIVRWAEENYEKPDDYWDSVEPDIQPLDEDCVYWTPGGKSFHSTEDCVALLRSSDVRSTSLRLAYAAGKTDPCSKCVGD